MGELNRLNPFVIKNAIPGKKWIGKDPETGSAVYQDVQGGYRLPDGGSMYLLVTDEGAKYWRMDYRYAKKYKTLAFGVYPAVSLQEARDARDAAKKQLRAKIDPGLEKQKTKQRISDAVEFSFERIAHEWLEKESSAWSIAHAERVKARIYGDVIPWIGSMPIASIRVADLLGVLQRIQNRGAVETAHRVNGYVSSIFSYAALIAVPDLLGNPAAGLTKALIPKPKSKHFAAIFEPHLVGKLLRDIDGHSATLVVKSAMQLAPYVFVRPGELRTMKWMDVGFDERLWRFTSSKKKKPHLVPLSQQAVGILQVLKMLTGRGVYVFPNARSPKGDRPMSEAAVLVALRNLGYAKDQMSGHGFRHMASTLLHERGFDHDLIERQMSHSIGSSVAQVYDHAVRLSERRNLMQEWADYLDSLKNGEPS